MGSLCSCCENQANDQLTHTTPLLAENRAQGQPKTSQVQVPSYHAAKSDNPSASARQHRPPDKAEKEKQFSSSLDQVVPVTLAQLPAQVGALNKTLQDHGKLYNDLYNHFQKQRQLLNDFKSKFLKETSGIPVMADCLKVLSNKCGGAKLTLKREKRCIQILYNAREVSEKCEGLPEDVIQAIELYNQVNQSIKTILDKSPQVLNSLNLVLADEDQLKREVLKSDLPSNEGPEAMRKCTENINRLRKLSGNIETMQKYTDKLFQEILEGSKVLLNENGQRS